MVCAPNLKHEPEQVGLNTCRPPPSLPPSLPRLKCPSARHVEQERGGESLVFCSFLPSRTLHYTAAAVPTAKQHSVALTVVTERDKSVVVDASVFSRVGYSSLVHR